MTSPTPLPRLAELTRALRIAIDVGACHLRAAADAEPHSADCRELVQLARDEFAIALKMLAQRRPLLAPSEQARADRTELHALAQLEAIANEMVGPPAS